MHIGSEVFQGFTFKFADPQEKIPTSGKTGQKWGTQMKWGALIRILSRRFFRLHTGDSGLLPGRLNFIPKS